MWRVLFYLKASGYMDEKDRRLNKLENEMTDVKTRIAVAESNIKEIREDISGIKDNTTWILRLIIGGIIGAIITFLASGGFAL